MKHQEEIEPPEATSVLGKSLAAADRRQNEQASAERKSIFVLTVDLYCEKYSGLEK